LSHAPARRALRGWLSEPAHVVTKWLGLSPLVAAKHYLQTRDAHFEVAIQGGACSSGSAQPSEARARR
jgi:hypothetical protein